MRVVDRPGDPDPGFAAVYAALPDAADLQPWLDWARSAGGPVLYLGVGAGRIALPLVAAGVEVVGVDAHPGMLEALARRAPAMELHRSLFAGLHLGRRFPLVMLPSSVATSEGALPAAARHVAAGGRVALEVMNPHWLLGAEHPGVRVTGRAGSQLRIEVDYPGGAVQEATVEPWWPESVEARLEAAGLALVLLRGSNGDLQASPTWFALAEPARRRGRRA